MELIRLIGEPVEVEIPEEEKKDNALVRVSMRTLQEGKLFGMIPFFRKVEIAKVNLGLAGRNSKSTSASASARNYYPFSSGYASIKTQYGGAKK